jgi:hypothetical protein
MLLDLVTIAVLAFVGTRVVRGLRRAYAPAERRRTVDLLRGLRPRHFFLAVPVFTAVLVTALVLIQLPVLSFGWWTAIGGVGNPVTGGTERTTGTVLEWAIPIAFMVLLVPALPFFAEREERAFRVGAEQRGFWQRRLKDLQFGAVHAVIGIPIGVALALSIGGAYFTWSYLRGYRAGGGTMAALAESTRAHLAYNLSLVAIALAAYVAIAFGAA